MHESAMKYGKYFFETYCPNNFSGKTIVDVGAQDVNGSLREFCPDGASYIGVDFVEGKGVDVVLTDPYHLPFDEESVDVVVCSSVFEHSEFFWLLFLECIRILKPDGLLYLNAPSNGYVHRYPIDGWRFYPDAGLSLANWAKKNSYNSVLLESFVGENMGTVGGDGWWNDFVAVILKDEHFGSHYPARIVDGAAGVLCAYNSKNIINSPMFVQNPDYTKILEQKDYALNLDKKIIELDVEINNLSRRSKEKDEFISELTHELSERKGQISTLNRLIDEREGQIGTLNRSIDERDGRIAILNRIISVCDSRIDGLVSEMHALKNSSCWRMTSPVRFVVHQFFCGRQLIKIAPAAIKICGGVFGTAKRAVRLFQREGIAGIKRGIYIVQAGKTQSFSDEPGVFDRHNYSEWIRRYATLDGCNRSKVVEICKEWSLQPIISVVMPTYNPKPEWLVEAIESVRSQVYPNWELCIADDASTDPAIRPILLRYAQEDPRVKVTFRENNGHISAASNSALELSLGEWVALLDHDDLLNEQALFWVADAINRRPDVKLIYSDEDKLDEAGRRFDPYFKCDWNVDLFYSHNMISHLGVYRADLLREIGGFRLGMEGSQDYDLALRAIERIQSGQICHVPRVLYHWRMHAESTAKFADAKPYAMIAGERAINEHFQRTGVKGHVEFIGFGYRAHYDLPHAPPLVSLIIPTRNGLQLIRTCLESILTKTTYPCYEIIVVDNSSDDKDVLEYFENLSDSRVRVIRDGSPFNYSDLNNSAVKVAHGEVIGLLNNDLEVISPDWLSEMVSNALRPGVGAVGARLLFSDGTLQHGGVVLGLGAHRIAGHAHYGMPGEHHGYFGRTSLIHALSAVSAACLVIRKSIYEEVAGLNSRDLTVAFNDVDFCLRVREAGYRNVWTPYAELFHHESATRGSDNSSEKRDRFAEEALYMKNRWGDDLLNDPAYSPNLSFDHADFSLAWPPRVGRDG